MKTFRYDSSRTTLIFITALILYVALPTVTSQAQWTKVNLENNLIYNQILFTDSLHGYIAATSLHPVPTDTSGAILFITSDGGKSWKENKLAAPGLSSVSAIGDSLVWVSSGGTVYYSHDGGNTWQHSIASTKYQLLTVQFVDAKNGWGCGNTWYGNLGGYGGICHSSDGGVTWQNQYADSTSVPDHNINLEKGYFIDSLHGWVADEYTVHRTTDGGKTWTNVLTNDFMSSVYFTDTLRGWATGMMSFYKTTDGGVKWIESPSDTVFIRNPEISSVFFTDISNGWVSSSGKIFRTTDGGLSWLAQQSDTSSTINSLFFFNKNNGWAVGWGTVLHTTNGGVTAIEEPSLHPTAFRLIQNYPNPFNPSTAISYQLSAVSQVSLKVFNVLGRQVAALVNGVENAGIHTITWNAAKFASGVYFFRLISSSQQGTFVDTKSMMLIK